MKCPSPKLGAGRKQNHPFTIPGQKQGKLRLSGRFQAEIAQFSTLPCATCLLIAFSDERPQSRGGAPSRKPPLENQFRRLSGRIKREEHIGSRCRHSLDPLAGNRSVEPDRSEIVHGPPSVRHDAHREGSAFGYVCGEFDIDPSLIGLRHHLARKIGKEEQCVVQAHAADRIAIHADRSCRPVDPGSVVLPDRLCICLRCQKAKGYCGPQKHRAHDVPQKLPRWRYSSQRSASCQRRKRKRRPRRGAADIGAVIMQISAAEPLLRLHWRLAFPGGRPPRNSIRLLLAARQERARALRPSARPGQSPGLLSRWPGFP